MPDPTPQFDPAVVVDPFLNFFKGVVADPTNAELAGFAKTLVDDAASVANLYVRSADPALIDAAKASINARAQTIAAIPGLISAREQDNFFATVEKVFIGLVQFGIKVLVPH